MSRSNRPKPAEAIKPPHPALGQHQQPFPSASTSVTMGIVKGVAIFCICMALFSLTVVQTEVGLMLAALLVLIAIGLAIYAYWEPRLRADLYEHGLILNNGFRERVIPLSQILEIRDNPTYGQKASGAPSNHVRFWCYDLYLQGGDRVRLSGYQNIQSLGSTIDTYIARTQFEQSVQHIQAGETLRFRKIKVNLQGIQKGNQQIPWSAITTVSRNLRHDCVVESRDYKAPHFKLLAWDVSNFTLLQRLVANFVTSAREPSPPEEEFIENIKRIVPSKESLPATTDSTFAFPVITIEAQTGEINRQITQAEYRREALGHGIALEMVSIPGGSFEMGSPEQEPDRSKNEGPQHSVAIQHFWMGKYPITQAQWRCVASWPKVEHDLVLNPSHFQGELRPVETVNWYEAVEFCDRLTQKTGRQYRLPSEAEWEYACRAGTSAPFYFGDILTSDLANYDAASVKNTGPKGQARGETTKVGIFPPNAYGLYDLHGNVWEWCVDHYYDSYGGWFRKAPTDGRAWIMEGEKDKRVLRGGCWGSYARSCRCASRTDNPFPQNHRSESYGFRVVCAAPWQD